MLHNPYCSHFFEVPSPRSPYNGDIPNGLCQGKQIFIRGHLPHHANRFIFDLETPNGIALHFNPRFDESAIVRNSKVHGSWGGEERQGHFPFHRGQHFEVVIAVEHDRYRVAVNGAHVVDYRHRVPFQEVSRIAIHGDVELEQLIFSGASTRSNEVHPGPTPFSVPLHGVNPGKLIQIMGRTHHHTGRFNVNLQNGPGESNDIALHFSVRFDDPYTGQAVVRTNKRSGGWGGEDRDGGFPFVRGAPFELLILLEHNEWKVAVNGQHFVAFHHRNPFYDANHVAIDGDVEIQSIREY